MALIQLDPPIPLTTPKGHGYALLVLDYSQDHDLLWVVADDATGQLWTWPNAKVRAVRNTTLGRNDPERPKLEPLASDGPKPAVVPT